jgi:hypothetical protein
MSEQAHCTSEILVGAACTVSIGEHMVVPPISAQPFHEALPKQVIASWSPNRFHSKPLFSNDIKSQHFSGSAPIEALTVSGRAMWRKTWSHPRGVEHLGRSRTGKQTAILLAYLRMKCLCPRSRKTRLIASLSQKSYPWRL